MAQTPRNVPAFVSGEGNFLVDQTGRRYLDFSSQLVFTNVGHQHPRVVSAIKEQADRLCTLAPTWASDIRGEAAKMIIDVAPDRLSHVMFKTAARRQSSTPPGWREFTPGARSCSPRTARTTGRRPPLLEAAQQRWRYVNGARLLALVRAGAKFEKGVLVERPERPPRRSPRDQSGTRRPQLLTIPRAAAAISGSVGLLPSADATG